jgi:hypothetical protein
MHALGWGLPPFEIKTEGIHLSWALLLVVLMGTLSVVYYFSSRPIVGNFRLVILVGLRAVLLALFALLLTRPVLLVTLNEHVRGILPVLVDVSQSMNLKDNRVRAEDANRAAIALGLVSPTSGISQTLSASDAKQASDLSRLELVQAAAANTKLNLWSRINEKTDLAFFGLGSSLTDLGVPHSAVGSSHLDEESVAAFFKALQASDNQTALGDSLRDLLQQEQGEPVAGVVIITDGASNTGTPALEAAEIARQNHIPLYIYGVGITSPVDISVTDLEGPDSVAVREKAVFTVQVRGQGVSGQPATLVLKADGHQVDQKSVSFPDEAYHQVQLSFVPPASGMINLSASIAPLSGETVTANNEADLRVHAISQKVKILFADQDPSWDFQYLLAMAQRDRRLAPKAVLFDADPGLYGGLDSPYIETMPVTKSELYQYQILVLGDVDPANLNESRMKMIAQWVDKAGGGVVFRAGPHFDPLAYRGTPLEPLLPVVLPSSRPVSALYNTPVHLGLTPEGEASPILNLASDATKNFSIWTHFPGVGWTAPVGRTKAGAQALLADPTSARKNAAGPMPVIAVQNYGKGKTIFVGMRETYRWRTGVGEKYFTRIWSQIFQALASKTVGTSGPVRLKADHTHYQVGDHIIVSGTVYSNSFEPAREIALTGVMKIQPDPGAGKQTAPPLTADFPLAANGDNAGEYRGEITATIPGSYSLTLPQDPTTPIEWDVTSPSNLEQADVAMNATLLRQMAETTNGRFLREEDLDNLPGMISGHSATLAVDRRIDLIFSPWVLGAMIVLLGMEWLMRRLWKLK